MLEMINRTESCGMKPILRLMRRTWLLKGMIVCLICGCILPAQARERFSMLRRDAIETLRLPAEEETSLSFVCDRGASRPGSGRIELRVPRKAMPETLPGTALAVRFGNGSERINLPMKALPAENKPRAGNRDMPSPALVVLVFDQPGEEIAARDMGRIAGLGLARGVRSLQIELSSLDLSVQVPLLGAEKALRAFEQGCLDGIPDEAEEVQGPWHVGISSIDGDPHMALITRANSREPRDIHDPHAPKLALVCDNGDYSVRLLFPERQMEKPLRVAFQTGKGRIADLAFTPGPGPDEIRAPRDRIADISRLLWRENQVGISLEKPGEAQNKYVFDIYGLHFAARRFIKICANAFDGALN
jgi:hypothetical protein